MPSGTLKEAEPINFYPSPGHDEKRTLGKPPKPFMNPFEAATSPSPPRPVRDVLALLTNLDIERAVVERRLSPKSVPVNQLYQILKEETNARVTLDEVKTLVSHVRDKSGTAQRVSDDIDINDLMNAIMDIDTAPK